jgi:hypothetical protein
MRTREDAEQFTQHWLKAWNDLDLEAVLSHFHDDIVFHSPTAAALIGQSVVRGKPALRSYWRFAIERAGTLHFTLDHLAWDPERTELFIVFLQEFAGQRTRCCERLHFAGDLVIDGEGLKGAPLAPN